MHLFEKVMCVFTKIKERRKGWRADVIYLHNINVCVCVYMNYKTWIFFLFSLSLISYNATLPPTRSLCPASHTIRLSNSLSQKPVFSKFRGVLISRFFPLFMDFIGWQVLKTQYINIIFNYWYFYMHKMVWKWHFYSGYAKIKHREIVCNKVYSLGSIQQIWERGGVEEWWGAKCSNTERWGLFIYVPGI